MNRNDVINEVTHIIVDMCDMGDESLNADVSLFSADVSLFSIDGHYICPTNAPLIADAINARFGTSLNARDDDQIPYFKTITTLADRIIEESEYHT